MSVKYAAVKWNANKRGYDLAIVASVLAYLVIFYVCGKLLYTRVEEISDAVLLIRALGTCGILMLHAVLCLGPLARLDRRLLPLVYNRRHLGVATFLIGLLHGALVTGYYHGFGHVSPFLSLLTSNTIYNSWRAFPFEMLGMAALAILFLLASISHDFWQKNLGASFWKSLHMLVYMAYGLLILHVGLGALQSERSPVYPLLLALGLAIVTGLHLAVGWRESRRDAVDELPNVDEYIPGENWIEVARVDELLDCRAKIVCLPGRERVAIFRYGNRISAVTNVCAHQRGPLGEGKIVDGCITCPWHGWQYRPASGQSPPPFRERIATYRVRIESDRILLNPEPLPAGTPVKPALIEERNHETAQPGFDACGAGR